MRELKERGECKKRGERQKWRGESKALKQTRGIEGPVQGSHG